MTERKLKLLRPRLATLVLTTGLMNLFWMTAIFALFVVEKHWRHGLAVAKLAGSALVVLGVLVIARPELLAAISQ